MRYRAVFKKNINYKNPQTLNEKIHWLKFYSDTSLWVTIADKYAVREFVRSRGGETILNRMYTVWDSYEEIELSQLPDSFIIKLNDGCGSHLIVKNKRDWTVERIIDNFKSAKKYGLESGEYHYNLIKRKIIAEELLIDPNSPSDFLIDYRFWCCNGIPRFINVHANAGGVLCGTFDADWNFINPMGNKGEGNVAGSLSIEKPASFDEMKKWAVALSKDIPFVRVDFYEINGKPIFGEMTLTPGAGFIKHYSDDFLLEMGGYIKLPTNTRSSEIKTLAQ